MRIIIATVRVPFVTDWPGIAAALDQLWEDLRLAADLGLSRTEVVHRLTA